MCSSLTQNDIEFCSFLCFYRFCLFLIIKINKNAKHKINKSTHLMRTHRNLNMQEKIDISKGEQKYL